MGLLEQQNFLARIFTNEDLRLSFWDDPEFVGKENGLFNTEIMQIKEIIAKDLEYFAGSLLNKRLHEVEKLLPLTKKVLGQEFTRSFREFAKSFQPSSIKKHLEDAIEFCEYLQNSDNFLAKDTAKFERTKHKFYRQQKLLSFCFLKHDCFTFKKKFRIAVWYRIGNRTRQLIL